MTSAFDTIKRSVLLDILREAGCSEDDLKLVRYLLSNTKLKIKIEKTGSMLMMQTLLMRKKRTFKHFCLYVRMFYKNRTY